MNKKRLLVFLVVGLAITLLSLVQSLPNESCELMRERHPSSIGLVEERGFPLPYNADAFKQCSTGTEVGYMYTDFAGLHQMYAFLFNWLCWTSISYTLFSLSKRSRKK